MDLIQQWRSGAPKAFEAPFHRSKNMAFRNALLMVADEYQAEDMLREAFIKFYKSKDKFQGDENGFKQWLYRITMNICIDHHPRKLSVSSLKQMSEEGFGPGDG